MNTTQRIEAIEKDLENKGSLAWVLFLYCALGTIAITHRIEINDLRQSVKTLEQQLEKKPAAERTNEKGQTHD